MLNTPAGSICVVAGSSLREERAGSQRFEHATGLARQPRCYKRARGRGRGGTERVNDERKRFGALGRETSHPLRTHDTEWTHGGRFSAGISPTPSLHSLTFQLFRTMADEVHHLYFPPVRFLAGATKLRGGPAPTTLTYSVGIQHPNGETPQQRSVSLNAAAVCCDRITGCISGPHQATTSSGSLPESSTVVGERGELLALLHVHPKMVTSGYAVSAILIKRPEEAEVCRCLTARLPPIRNGFKSRRCRLWIFAYGIVTDDAAGRRVFLGDIPFPPPLQSGAAPYSSHFTLIGSQDFDRIRKFYTSFLGVPASLLWRAGDSDPLFSRSGGPWGCLLSPGCCHPEFQPPAVLAQITYRGALATRINVHRQLVYTARDQLAGKGKDFCYNCVLAAGHNTADRGRVDKSGPPTRARTHTHTHTHKASVIRAAIGKYRPPITRSAQTHLDWLDTPAAVATSGTSTTARADFTCRLRRFHGRLKEYFVLKRFLGNRCLRRYDKNTARLARRSDEALGLRVTVARIFPSLLDLGRSATQYPAKIIRQTDTTRQEEGSGHDRRCGSTMLMPSKVCTAHNLHRVDETSLVASLHSRRPKASRATPVSHFSYWATPRIPYVLPESSRLARGICHDSWTDSWYHGSTTSRGVGPLCTQAVGAQCLYFKEEDVAPREWCVTGPSLGVRVCPVSSSQPLVEGNSSCHSIRGIISAMNNLQGPWKVSGSTGRSAGPAMRFSLVSDHRVGLVLVVVDSVCWRRSGEIPTLYDRSCGERQPAPVVPWKDQTTRLVREDEDLGTSAVEGARKCGCAKFGLCVWLPQTLLRRPKGENDVMATVAGYNTTPVWSSRPPQCRNSITSVGTRPPRQAKRMPTTRLLASVQPRSGESDITATAAGDTATLARSDPPSQRRTSIMSADARPPRKTNRTQTGRLLIWHHWHTDDLILSQGDLKTKSVTPHTMILGILLPCLFHSIDKTFPVPFGITSRCSYCLRRGKDVLDTKGIDDLRVKARALVRKGDGNVSAGDRADGLGELSPVLKILKNLPDGLMAKLPELNNAQLNAVVVFFESLNALLSLGFCSCQDHENIIGTFLGFHNTIFQVVANEAALTKFRPKLLEKHQMVGPYVKKFVTEVTEIVGVIELPCSEDYIMQVMFSNLLPQYSSYYIFTTRTCTLRQLLTLVSEVENLQDSIVSQSVNVQKWNLIEDKKSISHACFVCRRKRSRSKVSQGKIASTQTEKEKVQVNNSSYRLKDIICFYCKKRTCSSLLPTKREGDWEKTV
ncbi:hypothetical protein PR048_015659 [Dryococelus australis]|uniref:Uncharacterized protein n=1 Tax=Dryococelus australis TaxID=614101 RepID=A0ABQ9HHM3_9NEOP|nr:hypothetical protein PR048_015659 [Dryococelus australis]